MLRYHSKGFQESPFKLIVEFGTLTASLDFLSVSNYEEEYRTTLFCDDWKLSQIKSCFDWISGIVEFIVMRKLASATYVEGKIEFLVEIYVCIYILFYFNCILQSYYASTRFVTFSLTVTVGYEL